TRYRFGPVADGNELVELEEEGLVEREAELRAATAALDGIAAGAGTVISVEGPAGIGKSALIAEVAARAGNQGFAGAPPRGESGLRGPLRTRQRARDRLRLRRRTPAHRGGRRRGRGRHGLRR